mmetsp:Transcript_50917/g.146270  ORF Transcript_50917/g.146270 Transcript_50917/m.146270 type:complete len:557 (+) Transcript_50917:79-1749(+)
MAVGLLVGCASGLALGVGLAKTPWEKAWEKVFARRKARADDDEDGVALPASICRTSRPPSVYAGGFARWSSGAGSVGKVFGCEEGTGSEVLSPGVRRLSQNKRRRDSALFTQVEQRVTEEKLVIVMVGLPARGKSYISKALVRYLNFLGCTTSLFNAGSLRRDEGGAGVSASYFDPNNLDAKAQREAMAMQCLEELLGFLREKGNNVGILDATNTTIDRRTKVRNRCAKEQGISVIFLESLCTDSSVLEENYRLKLVNDDYKGMDAEEATADFLQRVVKYEEAYQPVEDVEDGVEMSYIKLIDAGKKLTKNLCLASARKSLPGHVFNLLHSIHLGPRSIFLALVGESENDVVRRFGGDSALTPAGQQRGPALAKFLDKHEAEVREQAIPGSDVEPTLVMCGTLQRHLHTAHHLKLSRTHRRSRTILKLQRLNELCVGGLDGMTRDEVEEYHSEESRGMLENKLTYRYPGEGGESYQDLILRLHENILRLEQLRGSALLLCDPGVFRVFLAYFRGTPLEQIHELEVPKGVIQLTRTHSGFQEMRIDIPVPKLEDWSP